MQKTLAIVGLFLVNLGLAPSLAWAVTDTAAVSASPTAASPAPASPSAQAADDDSDYQADTYTVTGWRIGGTATKLNVPLSQVPSAVVVVSGESLKQQNVNDWVGAMRNVAGVVPYRTYGGFTQAVMRGLGRNDLLYLFDGVRDAATAAAGSSSPQANNSMENIDRVEVLKGPSALLYGQGAVAGVINSIRKKPSSRAAYEFGTTLGEFDKWRAYLGAQGPVMDSSLSYRLDVGFDDNRGFRKARESRSAISLSLSQPLWRGAEVSFYSTLESDRYDLDGGIPVDKTTFQLRPGTPLDKRYNTANDFQTRQNGQYLLELSQSVGDWKLANSASYMPNEDVYLNAETLTLSPTANIVNRDYLYFDTIRYPWQDNLELTGKINALGEHKVLLGYEYQYYLQYGLGFQGGFGTPLAAAPPSEDLLNPVDTAPILSVIHPNRRTVTTNSGQAVYLQDYWTLHEKVKVLLGGRYDDWRRTVYLQKLDQSDDSRSVIDTYSTTVAATAAPVYKTGLVLGPFKGATFYVSQSDSYFPNFKADSADGRVSFAPETSDMLEGGMKFEGWDEKVAADLSVYDIMKHNILDNPAPVGGVRTYHQAGTLRSTGFESNLTLRPDAYNSLQIGYAYTDASYYSFLTDPNLPNDKTKNFSGNRPAFVPVNSATLWGFHSLPNGFGVGLGGRYTGETFTNDNNFVRMPAYAIANGAAYYHWDDSELQVNVDNLFDKRDYFVSSINTFQLYPGEPRSMSVRYSRKF